MSRIRQIKPSWFLDKELRRGTTADAREFYIGLWMLADDAGYLRWDVERIAAELYPYDGVAARERRVSTWAESLETLNPDEPHLVVWTCGHGRVPKMPAHQRIAGKQTVTVKEAHLMCRDAVSRRRLPVAIEAGEPNSATDSPGREPGRERNGTVVVSDGNSEFQKRVPRPGKVTELRPTASIIQAHGERLAARAAEQEETLREVGPLIGRALAEADAG